MRWTAMLPAWVAIGAADAIVIRHDVPDAQYLAYADEPPFTNVGLLVYNGIPSGSGTVDVADLVAVILNWT